MTDAGCTSLDVGVRQHHGVPRSALPGVGLRRLRHVGLTSSRVTRNTSPRWVITFLVGGHHHLQHAFERVVHARRAHRVQADGARERGAPLILGFVHVPSVGAVRLPKLGHQRIGHVRLHTSGVTFSHSAAHLSKHRRCVATRVRDPHRGRSRASCTTAQQPFMASPFPRLAWHRVSDDCNLSLCQRAGSSSLGKTLMRCDAWLCSFSWTSLVMC